VATISPFFGHVTHLSASNEITEPFLGSGERIPYKRQGTWLEV